MKEENTINVVDGRFLIPKKFRSKKGFMVTQHRVIEIFKGRSINVYMRHKPDKPYIPEGFIEFKVLGEEAERYKAKRITTGELLNFIMRG